MSSKESAVAETAILAPEKSSGDVPATELVSGDSELLGMWYNYVIMKMTGG